ncbi:pimeloyl-ACP methyl ester carboxylesterase [Actinoalloteichus hoggarensis]|uniref:4,5:9,10-diseco-3-hydroxy-5,9, 17-trioxoandrosta-1(10),2-diene-4-oate hydrolase n=1 Tax=Actinoalloteichus hoggarensis TaxID=1470176 RepID=A0A221W007_9PSEU|nr:alpha/beta hydrolase [Actinoalloteichus hoggarensis]ASO19107.1 4,5:9,10-diseco-3-hydroxy-5,9,17-trioxoandrosta-1(10),2-diene-4-oate hydrolase [Actinoalloteichus hoggarensis]MBB5920344.1 pimeloyl-ACP methyl ester carboxylesterase [Actinoalloteichus hoggarensis]
MDRLDVHVGGTRVAYLKSSADDDARAVVFVHGNSSSARTWLPQLTGDLGRRFRCFALDLPGHGHSDPAHHPADYSLPGYVAVLTGFMRELDIADAVVVGWSLGGQIVMEAAPELPDAAGFVVFGAPPVATPAQLSEAFLPNPDMAALFDDQVSEPEAKSVAGCFVATGSSFDVKEFVSDILSTDGAARTGLGASLGAGRFADEIAIVSALEQPLGIVHGEAEQLVSLAYLRKLDFPALWRDEVQVIPGVGHALHQEAPRQFAALLSEFVGEAVHVG